MPVLAELNRPQHTMLRVALIYALGVLGAMAVSEAVPVLGGIAREFRPHNPLMLGLLITMPSLIVALGALLAGWTTDRLGDRPVLLTGAAITIAGDLCVIAAPSMGLLLAGRALTGVGYVAMAVSAITMMMRITTGRQRIFALSLWSTFVPVSFILPFLTIGLVMQSGTWRTAFVGHAVVIAVLAAIAVAVLPSNSRRLPGQTDLRAGPSRTAGLGQVLRAPRVYLLGLSFGAAALLQSGIIATLAPYLAHRYGVSEVSAQAWNTVAMVANTIGCLIVGQLLNANVPARIIGFAGLAIAAVAAASLFGLDLGYTTSIGVSWLFMFGCGLLVGMWALLPLVAPQGSMGATSGLVTQLTLLGVVIGTPVCLAAQASGMAGPMLAVIGVASLACLAGVPIWLMHVPDADASTALRGGAQH